MSSPLRSPSHKPNAFLVWLWPKSQTVAALPAPSLPFRLAFETADQYGIVDYADRAMQASSADGRRFLILGGAIYRPQSTDIGRTLLGLYEQRGIDIVRDLSGSFALLLVNQDAGEIAFATDRLNTVKLLVSEFDGSLIVSNAMDAHPLRDVRLDPAGIVSYLASGYIYSERTVLDGVRVLDGGSIYRPRGVSLVQQRYWRYLPSDDMTSPTRPAFRRDLEDALVDAVRVRVRSDRPIYLSLSVGYDSRTIAGILTERLHVEGVSALSYTYGPPQPMTNEALAPKIAALCGYEHQLVSSFQGRLMETVMLGGQLGAGMADVCDELDAWRTFAVPDGDPRPLLFAGDTIMPPFNVRLTSAEDALQGAKMVDLSAASWIAPIIGPERYARWLALTRAELDSALQRVEPNARGASLYRLYDILRVENPDNRRIFPWREYYTGRFFDVVNPLLDETVTELFMNAPVPTRRGRRVFIEIVTALFPKLFALPRVTAGHYADYWSSALADQGDDVRAWIRSVTSPLDDLIEPDILLALLDYERAVSAGTGTTLRSVEEKVFHWARRIHWRPATFQRPYLVRPTTSPQQFLKRALVLRAFFQSAQARQSP